MCKALRTQSLHLTLGTQQALGISCHCQPIVGHVLLGWLGLERSELSVRKLSCRTLSGGEAMECGGLGVANRPGQGAAGEGTRETCSVAVGPAQSWTSAGLTVAPVSVFGKSSKMTGIFQIACFSILRPPSPPILRSNSEQNFEMCQEQEGESVKTPQRIVNPASVWQQACQSHSEKVCMWGCAHTCARVSLCVSSDKSVSGHES